MLIRQYLTHSEKVKILQNDSCECSNTVKLVAESVPEPIIIVNHDRRLVWQNSTALDILSESDINKLYMQLPGTIFGCAGLNENAECGSGKFCKYCGANRAFQSALKGNKATNECSILRKDGDLLELKVTATPIEIDSAPHIFVFIKNLSDIKRKAVLEKLFFHDIMNMISGFSTMSDLIEHADDLDELKEVAPLMRMTTISLTDEIRLHKLMFEAESGDLVVSYGQMMSLDLLEEIKSVYSANTVCYERTIEIDPASQNIYFVSDKTILKRVLGNLVKNALEACTRGEKVVISAHSPAEDSITFSVHNNSVIPEAVQAKLFHRSVSTKGDGRGLGTHSVKLLTEKFLKGKASFISTPETGTIFSVTYPIDPELIEDTEQP
jgi:hypothetical protein